MIRFLAYTNSRERGDVKMMKFQEIIDTWDMIERYNVKGWKLERGVVWVPKAEYDRILKEAKAERYIKNLLER
jgi:hypothetical protein